LRKNSGVIVIAATNKIEVLDDALLRAGRLIEEFIFNYQTLRRELAL